MYQKHALQSQNKPQEFRLTRTEAENICISENLTAWRAELFRQTRTLKKKYPNAKARTVDGNFFSKNGSQYKGIKN